MLVLRQIRKAKWYKHENVPWLAESELQADALGDLHTTHNELSVWYVEDNRSNFERIVAALAANRDRISNFDYALFRQEHLSEINIKVKHTEGDSPDEEANATWHYDLVELPASKLMELAKAIQANAEIGRFSEKQILQLVAQTVASGHVDLDQTRLTEKEKDQVIRQRAAS